MNDKQHLGNGQEHGMKNFQTEDVSELFCIQFQQEPVSFTQLVGREENVKDACALIRRSDIRLLTLTGPGGIGKTRLSRQMMNELQQEFPGGTCFVGLAPLSTPKLLAPLIAYALGLQRSGTQSFLDYLKDFFQEKHFLLILDNFEHVLAATSLVIDLLVTCPFLKIVVTSRALLHIQGEYEFSVPALALPEQTQFSNIEAFLQVASIKLFLQRVQAMQHIIELTQTNVRSIAEICMKLDGLPLAIELAAARMKLLSPQALLTRLEYQRLQVLTAGGLDLPARQHTMYDTIQWSYDLLTSDEQHLFRFLSVFVGGCTISMIEDYCTVLNDVSMSVLDTVMSLVNKSLLKYTEQKEGEPRLTMLGTIREFGLDMLRAHGELAVAQNAHAECFRKLVEQANISLLSAIGPKLAPLTQEYENGLSALQWLLEQSTNVESVETALHIAGVLGQLTFLRGQPDVGRVFLDMVLSASDTSSVEVSPILKAEASFVAGLLTYWCYDEQQASTLLQQGLTLFREQGEQRGIAACLNMLGLIEVERNDKGPGDTYHEEALRLYRVVADKAGIANVLHVQGVVAFFRGQFALAQARCEESLVLFKQLHATWGIAASLTRLGWIAYCEGTYQKARQLAQESVSLFETLGYPCMSTEARTILAYILSTAKEETDANTLLEQTLAHERVLGSKVERAQTLCALGYVSLRQKNSIKARQYFEDSLRQFTTGLWTFSRIMITNAFCLEGLSEIALSQGHVEWTVLLLGAADAIRSINGTQCPIYIAKASFEQTLAVAQTQLSEDIFTQLWVEGRIMTVEQVLAAEHRVVRTQPSPNKVSSHTASAPVVQEMQDIQSLLDDTLLTGREIEVLHLIAQGLTNNEIAHWLYISPHTVNAHVKAIYSKLDVTNRSGATSYAIKRGLI